MQHLAAYAFVIYSKHFPFWIPILLLFLQYSFDVHNLTEIISVGLKVVASHLHVSQMSVIYSLFFVIMLKLLFNSGLLFLLELYFTYGSLYFSYYFYER